MVTNVVLSRTGMSDVYKRKQVRIYLDADDEAKFASLMENLGKMPESTIMSAIVSAGLNACVAIGNRVPLPLKFDVASDDVLSESSRVTLNETGKRRKKIKYSKATE